MTEDLPKKRKPEEPNHEVAPPCDEVMAQSVMVDSSVNLSIGLSRLSKSILDARSDVLNKKVWEQIRTDFGIAFATLLGAPEFDESMAAIRGSIDIGLIHRYELTKIAPIMKMYLRIREAVKK